MKCFSWINKKLHLLALIRWTVYGPQANRWLRWGISLEQYWPLFFWTYQHQDILSYTFSFQGRKRKANLSGNVGIVYRSNRLAWSFLFPVLTLYGPSILQCRQRLHPLTSRQSSPRIEHLLQSSLWIWFCLFSSCI